MTTKEYLKSAQKARDLLYEAYVEFADGDDHLKACERLWQSAAHAIAAVAQQRGWEYSDLESLSAAADRLSEEMENPLLASEFEVADTFRLNADLGFMEDFQLKGSRPGVRHFVECVLALPELSSAINSEN